VPADPQAAGEQREAARHLLQRPLTCQEHDPEMFRLIRRHEADLDRWFTQRLGYRLHVDADSARLWKSGYVADHRPLRTSSGRPFHPLEYVLAALVLASTAAGPAVVSLRDLVEEVRSSAAEAGIDLVGDSIERRALVSVLRWMIDLGLAEEMHATVQAYSTDVEADAVLRVRPDRIALLPLPGLLDVTDAAGLLDAADRRGATRTWLRCRLVEDPVLYADDLTEAEWSELRRRLGEEERMLEEMFGLRLETRAEGSAAVDPTGRLSGVRFPSEGTVGHAGLLLLAVLTARGTGVEVSRAEVVVAVTDLAERHRSHWSNDLVATPDHLTRQVVELLVSVRVARPTPDGGLVLLPAAARFLPVAAEDQPALW
jgi:uncharacterized protein (TIGR02678 family)